MSTVWMNSGIAIQRMVRGLATMTSPLKENSSTRVASRAVMVIGVSTWRNFSSNHCRPLAAMIQRRDRKPATSGSAT